MAQSLYRKHRPQRFDELVGQGHVTTALRNAVRDDRVGHAYLFSGPRGTGKTTTARILAKALNCLAPAEGEPCGTCENCVAIAEGRFLDLFELDAASNNSVDNVRDLTESVHLGLGASARTKVYLVDEVHMLSNAAGNALLKTLEEPPGHVVFVLATTNPEKVLPTIRSRTQHFEFTLLSLEQLRDHLADVLKLEGIDAEPAALEIVARAGAGSVRDSLSLLDQALAHGGLDTDTLQGLFGSTSFDARIAILSAIGAEDVAGALVGLHELLESGHEPRRVAEDLLHTARDAFLRSAAKGRLDVDAPAAEQDRLDQLGEVLGHALLVRSIETLGAAIVDMRGTDTADPRLVLEVAVVRLARRDAGPPLQSLVERVERLERAAPASGDAHPAAIPTPVASSGPAQGSSTALGALRKQAKADGAPAIEVEPPQLPEAPDEPPPPPAASTNGDLDIDDVIVAWAELLPSLPVATRTAVQEAQPVRVDGDVIVFGISPRLVGAARPRFKKVADQIRDALSERLGRTLKFSVVAEETFASVGPGGGRGAPPPEPQDTEETVDLTQLTDAEPGAHDSVARLQDAFGASIVEDAPQD